MEKDTPQKDKIRRATLEYLHEFFLARKVKEIKFLTLPGTEWIFERAMRTRFHTYSQHRIITTITACERDYKVFTISAAKMPGSNRILAPRFSDKLNHYVVTNHKEKVYLLHMDVFDLLSMFKDNIKDKRSVFDCIWLDSTNTVISIGRKIEGWENKLAPNAVVILTVLKGREHVKLETDRVTYISNILAKYDLKLVHQWEYFDTSPMLHLIFTKEQQLPELDQIIA